MELINPGSEKPVTCDDSIEGQYQNSKPKTLSWELVLKEQIWSRVLVNQDRFMMGHSSTLCFANKVFTYMVGNASLRQKD